MRRYRLMIGALLVAGLGFSGAQAVAEGGHCHGHASSSHGHGHGQAQGEERHAFENANARMHEQMNLPASGDVDLDFARGMLAHHRGAVEMAEIELEKGSDPEMRDLAREVIDAQQREIDQLERWIEARESEMAE